jgi:hypothetical protein
MMAIVGGIVCVVNARRTKDSTITILVKDVIITNRLGKIANPAKMITSLTGVDQSLPLASLLVALSITVIKSPMLGTPFTGALVAEVPLFSLGRLGCGNTLLFWPKDDVVSTRTTTAGKNDLISLPVIYSPIIVSFFW